MSAIFGVLIKVFKNFVLVLELISKLLKTKSIFFKDAFVLIKYFSQENLL